jgi:muramoyltetrapeptide carboxypeptidase
VHAPLLRCNYKIKKIVVILYKNKRNNPLAMINPPFLKKGDTVSIVATAKAISVDALDYAINFFQEKGYKVKVGKYIHQVHHQSAGTDAERLHDINEAINDTDVKAIICFRGGYGSVRIVEDILWNKLKVNPKWIVGFSDVTVLHSAMQTIGVQSAHATMPINYKDNTPEALDSLFNALEGKPNVYEISAHANNVQGTAEAELIGGNLAILYSLLGTKYEMNYENKLLFIEDVSEFHYHLDRMFWSLRLSGKLTQIKGLIVGGFTDMKDGVIPFGKTAYEIIAEHTAHLGIPVCYDFPVAHLNDNRAMVLGKTAKLEVMNDKVIFKQ